ncbi:hypothetical protein J4401_03830 [Candidatus Woesearchaeota archaeon]|nr:hypothetical protein [Candidatus Woesearchaeota archaeon]
MLKMAQENMLRSSFGRVKRDIDSLRYEMFNSSRYSAMRIREQAMRIRELERRLSQLERLAIREKIIRGE